MERVPPELTSNARCLRSGSTFEERLLWSVLCQQRPRFTRQLVVDRFILDFACRSLKIAIEVDGGQHGVCGDEDADRTAELERRGWIILRFWNSEVRNALAAVVGAINEAIARAATHPQPLPSREGS
ncbi:MAG: DUF559 domain-containing protein [Sphingomonadaceae bacterium]|nr:DUF559 domain-containing protein [Sphingomonadaceae bacterium]